MPPRKKEVAPEIVRGNLAEMFGTTSCVPYVADDGLEETKPDFFGTIQNFFTKRVQVTAQSTNMEPFIQARFISMAGVGFNAATAYNRLSARLPKWARPVVLYWLTPGTGRAPRMEYIKAAKDKNTPAYEEVVAKLVSHLHCSPRQAEQTYTELEAQAFDVYAFFGLKTPKGYNGAKVEKETTPPKGVPRPAPKRGNWKL